MDAYRLRAQRIVVAVKAVQSLVSFGLAAWLLMSYLGRGEASVVLLLVYWTLNLPVLGEEVALVAQQYPALRNVTLRLLEPLGRARRPMRRRLNRPLPPCLQTPRHNDRKASPSASRG